MFVFLVFLVFKIYALTLSRYKGICFVKFA